MTISSLSIDIGKMAAAALMTSTTKVRRLSAERCGCKRSLSLSAGRQLASLLLKRAAVLKAVIPYHIA
jgi:hypothetical protein